jgi:hypothetical protein
LRTSTSPASPSNGVRATDPLGRGRRPSSGHADRSRPSWCAPQAVSQSGARDPPPRGADQRRSLAARGPPPAQDRVDRRRPGTARGDVRRRAQHPVPRDANQLIGSPGSVLPPLA